MSIGNRYSWRNSFRNCKPLKADCCGTPVQQPPAPCCEAHDTVCVTDKCFRPTCNVVATYPDPFWLTFSNAGEDQVPLNAAEVFFYHSVAGFLNILAFDNGSFKVSLRDPSRVGSVIQSCDCVLVQAIPSEEFIGPSFGRCLTGQFAAPALNATQTIYIYNGSSIPIGAIITFTADGETGSYEVTAYVSAEGNVYAYTVTNTGGGHTPGTIINGGEPGNCSIPIEVITNVDLCDLPESPGVDTIVGCLNGSPRAFKADTAGRVPISNSEGNWDLTSLTNLDCCVVTEGCLKFSGDNLCLTGEDCTTVVAPAPECITLAYEAAQAAGTTLPANINGYPVIISGWDPGTRTICVTPVDDSILGDEAQVQFDAGTSICLGDCCNRCTNGPQITDYLAISDEDPAMRSLFALNVSDIPFDAEDGGYYLIGFDPGSDLTAVAEVLSGWPDAPPSTGPGNPPIDSAFVCTQKLCNTDPRGCSQHARLEYNYELAIGDLPDGMSVNYEFGSYIGTAKYGPDGITPSTIFVPSSQSSQAGTVYGPSFLQSTIIANSAIGYGNAGNPKVYPYVASVLNDHVFIFPCSCALAVLWLYIQIKPLPSYEGGDGTIDIQCAVRRIVQKNPLNKIALVLNDTSSPGFAA